MVIFSSIALHQRSNVISSWIYYDRIKNSVFIDFIQINQCKFHIKNFISKFQDASKLQKINISNIKLYNWEGNQFITIINNHDKWKI